MTEGSVAPECCNVNEGLAEIHFHAHAGVTAESTEGLHAKDNWLLESWGADLGVMVIIDFVGMDHEYRELDVRKSYDKFQTPDIYNDDDWCESEEKLGQESWFDRCTLEQEDIVHKYLFAMACCRVESIMSGLTGGFGVCRSSVAKSLLEFVLNYKIIKDFVIPRESPRITALKNSWPKHEMIYSTFGPTFRLRFEICSFIVIQ